MKTDIIRLSEMLLSTWSGGTTTQLAIYPPQATLRQADFVFRLSTATVETEESVFTILPGISRKIMVLDGTLRLEHKGHHSVTLNKFETDEFIGDWETRAFGQVTDFNLMTRENASGTIEGFHYDKGTNKILHFSADCRVACFYVLNGIVQLNGEQANEGDVLMVWKEENDVTVSILSDTDSEIVLARINF